MTKEKQEVATTGSTAVAEQNKELIDQLRANSGESSSGSLPFLPIFQVDNTKEKIEAGGRQVDALCEPRWKITSKVEDDYCVVNVPTFSGIILKIMWQVVNNGKWDPTTNTMISNGYPMFRSPLFNPSVLFGRSYLNIKMTETNEIVSMSYPELKQKFDKGFSLIGWVFALVDGELVRLKMSGASRSPLFDYPKMFKSNDSISAHYTDFSAFYEEKPQPHNIAKFELNTEKTVDIAEVIAAQNGLNEMYDNFATKATEVLGGEVVSQSEEIVIEGVIDEPTFK